jgi:hypothetical protein
LIFLVLPEIMKFANPILSGYKEVHLRASDVVGKAKQVHGKRGLTAPD